MTRKLQSIGAVSCSKVFALVYAILGFAIGGVVSLVAFMGVAAGVFGETESGGALGLFFGVGAVIVLPLFYGFCGAVGGLILAGLYNLVAKAIGGIELEVD